MTERLGISIEEGRFHRHDLIPWWEQDRLTAARALVLGAGALGNEIIKNLALLGVGHVHIVDLDLVEHSNLSRSVLFREEDQGCPKAEAAARGATRIYPDIEATWERADLIYGLGLGRYFDADIVIAGLDSREARLAVNAACIRTGRIFFDGAIEGINGVARCFDGRSGPCYECTMGERDWELVRRRRSCNLLSRDQMSDGYVPTTSTIASIVGGLMVQQAVLHLHDLNCGIGCGLTINGVGFDAWTVAYERNPDCYAHEEADELARWPRSTATWTVAAALTDATAALGARAVIDLRHDLLVARSCASCGFRDEPFKAVGRFAAGAALCPSCDARLDLDTVSSIDGDSTLCDRSLAELGLPTYDVLRFRAGERTLDVITDGDRPAGRERCDA